MSNVFYTLGDLVAGFDKQISLPTTVFVAEFETLGDGELKKYVYPTSININEITEDDITDDPMNFFNEVPIFPHYDISISHEKNIEKIGNFFEVVCISSNNKTKLFGDKWVVNAGKTFGLYPIIKIGESAYIKHPSFNVMVVRHRQ